MHSERTPAETEALSRKVLALSRRRITQLAPALLSAVWAMPDRVRSTPGALSTDGDSVWFEPEQVLADFRKDRDGPARQLLHVILHCLLGHLPLRPEFARQVVFDAAADLKAAQLAEALCGRSMAVSPDAPRVSFGDLPHLQLLCSELCSDADGSHGSYAQLSAAARFDDHRLWAPPKAVQAVGRPGPAGEGPSRPDWGALRQQLLDGTGGMLPGDAAGLLREVFSVPERGLSYAAFLRRFAAPRERLLLDPDSFDPRWYHLGLELFGDMPLLEPSELSEPPLPDDLVIALDTSGSCSGPVCTRFLKETLGILQDLSAGGARFRVLLLQCDTRIQQEVLLERAEQVDELFQSFTARGFGGTDFRPVFERVRQRQEDGTLPRVRGLLYLTDGCGVLPHRPADYPTVFLMPQEARCYWPDRASWITRLYFDETDFTVEEATS